MAFCNPASSLVPEAIFPACPRCYLSSNTRTVKPLTSFYSSLKITNADGASSLLQPHAAPAALCSTSVRWNMVCNWRLNQCRDVSTQWVTHTCHIKVFCFWYTPSGIWMKSVSAASLSCHVMDWCFSLWVGFDCVLLITYSLLISCVHIKVFRLGRHVSRCFIQSNNLDFCFCSAVRTQPAVWFESSPPWALDKKNKTWSIHLF